MNRLSFNRERWVIAAHWAGLLAFASLFFGPAISGDQVFSFRDAGHYYYRLFEWNESELRQGRLPIWNPLENTGVPQLADASSSVFYPGKLLLHAPILSYGQRYNFYIISHVLLGMFGTWLITYLRRNSPLASSLAGLSYAFGGVVLTQISNVVFLVGAGWLPWSVLCLLAMQRNPVRGTFFLASVLAMMVLGGDPQIAVHVVLLGLLFSAIGSRRLAVDSGNSEATTSTTVGLVDRLIRFANETESRIGPLAKYVLAAAAFAVPLCAIQVLPSSEWSRQSIRASYDLPRSLSESVHYAWRESRDAPNEWSKYVPHGVIEGVAGEPELGTHDDHIYQFSVPPWTVAELAVPNVGGKMFPTNRRWVNGLPGADRVWHPSMYAGTIPIALALMSWRLSRKRTFQSWCSWVATLSVLASFGWFGLGWLLRETMALTTGASPTDFKVGSPVGGIYWLLVTFLPYYVQFRYPAKWMVVACLAIALLAGDAFDQVQAPRARLRRLRVGLGGL